MSRERQRLREKAQALDDNQAARVNCKGETEVRHCRWCNAVGHLQADCPKFLKLYPRDKNLWGWWNSRRGDKRRGSWN